MNRLRRAFAALLTVGVFALAGCTSQKEKPMQVKTQAQAEVLVRGHAAAVAAVLGVKAADHETGVKPAPCQGKGGEVAKDGRFYTQGNYQLPLPASEHPRVLAALRDRWQRDGYRIKEFRMFNETEGTVAAENPADEVQISAESTRPATALALLILTPCYLPA